MKIYPVSRMRPLEGTALLNRTEDLVAAVREAAGDDADIMVDLHGRTTPAMGVQVGRVLAPYRPLFLEEPCQPGNVDAMVEVARALPIPIATGERLASRQEFRDYLKKRACAVIQPSVCWMRPGLKAWQACTRRSSLYLVDPAPLSSSGSA